MHTSDGSDSGKGPGRSSSSKSAPDADTKSVCGFPLAKMNKVGTFTCREPPVKDGRCLLHVGLTPDPEGIELERLRLLQEAAERHAFDADRGVAVGENGDKDLAFNRNARTAAALARARRALAKPKDARDLPETAQFGIEDNARGPAAESAPGAPAKDAAKD
jgi:hypothetical protein